MFKMSKNVRLFSVRRFEWHLHWFGIIINMFAFLNFYNLCPKSFSNLLNILFIVIILCTCKWIDVQSACMCSTSAKSACAIDWGRLVVS